MPLLVIQTYKKLCFLKWAYSCSKACFFPFKHPQYLWTLCTLTHFQTKLMNSRNEILSKEEFVIAETQHENKKKTLMCWDVTKPRFWSAEFDPLDRYQGDPGFFISHRKTDPWLILYLFAFCVSAIKCASLHSVKALKWFLNMQRCEKVNCRAASAWCKINGIQQF